MLRSPAPAARIVFFVLVAVVISLSLLAPSGASALTAAERAALTAMGINPDAADATLLTRLNGGCETNPYQGLERYNRGAQLTPRIGAGGAEMREGINSVLACRLLRFFEYARTSRGCQFTISSGYRSAQHQANSCASICGRASCSRSRGDSGDCAPPGSSCHQYGLAVDATASCMSWAQEFLGFGNPGPGASEYKIFFPLRSDSVHIQCVENRTAGCSPSTQACDGSGSRITPDLNFVPPPMQNTPFNGMGMMGGMPNMMQPQPQCSQGLIALNGTCVPSQTQTAQSPFEYFSPSSSSTASSTPDSYFEPISNTINPGTSPKPSTSTSAIDLINAIAHPESVGNSTETATGTSIALNDSLRNAARLSAQGRESSTTSTSSSVTLNPGIPQTFVSQDLSQTPTNFGVAYHSTFILLENLRRMLLAILQILQPFGGTSPRAIVTPPPVSTE